MIPKGLFSQLMLIILSVLIVVTYVKPSLAQMKSIQDNIATYKTEQQKVATVNQKLATLKATVNDIPEADRLRLLTYMPNVVDTIAVPRDIQTITDQAQVILRDIKYQGTIKAPVGEAIAVDTGIPEGHVFNVTLEGSYSQLKQVFAAFEHNAYPLEVHELTIAKKEGGFLEASLKVVTYNRFVPTPALPESLPVAAP